VGAGKDFDGRRARTPEQLEALNKYSNVLLDYCHFSDPICAVGSTPENVTEHLNYFLEHNEEATKWIVAKAQGKKQVSKPEASSASQSVRPVAATNTPESPVQATATGSHAEVSQTSSASAVNEKSAASAILLNGLSSPVFAVLGAAMLPIALWC
jgi:hypothetical protein